LLQGVSGLPTHILSCLPILIEAAKAKTLRAAVNAGLPEGITLVTEPEAAALCVLKDKLEEHRLKLRKLSPTS